jgi:hypothetical protein
VILVDDRRPLRVAALDVVAVEGDVDVADRDLGAAELADERVQALGENRPPGVDSNQGDRLLFVSLDDLVRDPDQSPAQIVVVEHDLLVAHLAPSRPHWTVVKGAAPA